VGEEAEEEKVQQISEKTNYGECENVLISIARVMTINPLREIHSEMRENANIPAAAAAHLSAGQKAPSARVRFVGAVII